MPARISSACARRVWKGSATADMPSALDPHYTDPRLVALYDLECGWSEDRQFYLDLAGTAPKRILDMACGTGLLTVALAAVGHAVTGADPAAAMLDRAQTRPGGDRVRWICAEAAAFRSNDRFDLIVMTGNAYQVFQTDAAAEAALAGMARHLDPGGRLAFETRNPAVDWAARWDGMAVDLPASPGPVRVTRHVVENASGLIRFETRYQLGDELLVSPSTLRFTGAEAVSRHLAAAGLTRHRILGGWQGESFDPIRHDAMVFIAETG